MRNPFKIVYNQQNQVLVAQFDKKVTQTKTAGLGCSKITNIQTFTVHIQCYKTTLEFMSEMNELNSYANAEHLLLDFFWRGGGNF